MSSMSELLADSVGIVSLAHFIESRFTVTTPDGVKKVKLRKSQRAIVNAIEFGYDIDACEVKPVKLPKGIVTNWPRGYGKSFSVDAGTAALVVLVPNLHVGIQAHSEGLSKERKNGVANFIKSCPATADMIVKETVTEIWLSNGSRVMAFPNSESIRGNHFHYLIIDEAAQFDDKIIAAASVPTTYSRGIRWMMLSTPLKGINDTYYGRKYIQGIMTRSIVCRRCYHVRQQEEFDGVSFPLLDVPELPDCINCGENDYEYGPGLHTIIPVDPWDCPFRTKQEIEELLEAEGNTPLARQEILGEFVASAANVFKEEWINQCIDPTLKNDIRPLVGKYYVEGVDFGKMRDASSFMITHADIPEGQTYHERIVTLDHAKTLEASTIAAQKYDYVDIRKDLVDLTRIHRVSSIIPDANNIGGPIIDELKADIIREGLPCIILSNKPGHDGFYSTNKDKIELIAELERLFSTGRIRIPPRSIPEINELVKELLAFSYETGSQSIIYGTQSAHDDRVLALALSCWGHKMSKWIQVESKLAGRYGKFDGNENIQDRSNKTVALARHWTTG